MNSADARPIVVTALAEELGREPTLAEVYVVQAVSRHEGGYGSGWKSPPHGPEAPGSHNWGAIQAQGVPAIWHDVPEKAGPRVDALRARAAPPSREPARWFWGLDYAQPRGWFWGAYRVYPSPVAGARDVAALLRRRGVLEPAVLSGGWASVAGAMYRAGYYGGMQRDPAAAVEAYRARLAAAGAHFAQLFHETDPLTDPIAIGGGDAAGFPRGAGTGDRGARAPRPGTLETVTVRVPRRRHAAYRALQAELGVRPDGIIGPLTIRALIERACRPYEEP